MIEPAPEPILVSACLIGEPVRYNGAHKQVGHAIFQRWQAEGRLIPVCPEVAGGLPVPRPPAEMVGGAGGARVLQRLARVVDPQGNDVSEYFLRGAEAAVTLARLHGIRMAVLKEGSPSCGSGYIYNGSFSGVRVSDRGVTAEALTQLGVKVFSEHQIIEADAWLRQLEAAT